jgi:hypothetical protein
MPMIIIEDTNSERYHINPSQVVYVKERIVPGGMMYKILLSNGESVLTNNAQGANCIIQSIKCKHTSNLSRPSDT